MKGKNRNGEPGLQENSVRGFTGRQGPVLALFYSYFFRKLCPPFLEYLR